MDAMKRITAAIVSPPIIAIFGVFIALSFVSFAVFAPFYFLFATDPFTPREN